MFEFIHLPAGVGPGHHAEEVNRGLENGVEVDFLATTAAS